MYTGFFEPGRAHYLEDKLEPTQEVFNFWKPAKETMEDIFSSQFISEIPSYGTTNLKLARLKAWISNILKQRWFNFWQN